MTFKHLGALLATLSLLTSCAKLVPGTLIHPVQSLPLAQKPRVSITVYPPTDMRPQIERTGDQPRVSAFVILIAFAYLKKRGNWVTNDLALSPALRYELDKMTRAHLQGSRFFKRVASGRAKTDFLLTVDLLHLYGTQYQAKTITASVGENSRSTTVATAAFGVYGNAVMRYRLYDQRGGKAQLFWERVILGTAQQGPTGKSMKHYGLAATAAARDSLAKMTLAVTDAIERYAPPPLDHEAFVAGLKKEQADGNLVFLVQRLSSDRSATEILTLHHNTGRVLGHRIAQTLGTGFGRPLEWMLSRQRLDGTRMPYPEYAALASYLAREYDLRRVDDIYHYHFCGKKRGGPSTPRASAASAAWKRP
ncbi:MAG: hypothetical protein JRH20_19495 [Deltaproteobacteria bacterium]|nr:hypothetical protein [Deltaproteobacteria bacterium]